LLWPFGQFAATGSSAASYQQAGEPVSQLINDFGPPVASPATARQRAAMPFVHLERDLWDLRDSAGNQIGPNALNDRVRRTVHDLQMRCRCEGEPILVQG
jgi:putative restriction endonuclease